MARERTPEGKRVVIPVRVSEPKADAIDKARGDMPRSVWVEQAIDAALAVPAAEQRRAPKPRGAVSPSVPAAVFQQPRRHADNCKCLMCKPPKTGDQQR